MLCSHALHLCPRAACHVHAYMSRLDTGEHRRAVVCLRLYLFLGPATWHY